MTKKYRLPRRVQLGRGNIIKVAIVSPTVLREAFEDEDPDSTLTGGWDSEINTIFIRSDLPLARRWYVYWHELLHAVNDIMDRECDPGIPNLPNG